MAQGKKPLKEGQKRRARKAKLKTRNHPKDRAAIVGYEERLDIFVKRAVQLKRIGHYHFEIADMIAKEFDLESTPAITTVADWLKAGSQAIRKDVEELQWQMRIEQFKDLERLKAKWMQIAMTDEIEIQRWRMEEGQLQPFMDEDATKEQLEATKQIVNIMGRQAKLLGLDMEKAVTPTGEGPANLQELQIWLIHQVNNITGAPNGTTIDVAGDVLELTAGIPETPDEV